MEYSNNDNNKNISSSGNNLRVQSHFIHNLNL